MELKVPGLTVRLEVVLASMVLGFVIALMTLRSCSKVTIKEGLSVMNTLYNLGEPTQSTPASVDEEQSNMMSKWVGDSYAYAQQMGNGYQTVLDRVSGNVGTKVPLEDTMVFYRDNEFKPECCPSSYSSSTGCMCMSPEQVKYLAQRGGNRTCECSEF
jgi:hypothetical protein